MSLCPSSSLWFLCMTIVLFSTVGPKRADAQLADIRGSVVDSTNRMPVAGAVVMLLDETGATLTRTMVSERGTYRLLRLPKATQLRVVRLGFAPLVLPLTAATGRPEGGYLLDVRLPPLARSLGEVAVAAPVARGCETRSDHIRSLALLEAARAGVLSTIVANEHDPPRLTILRYERLLDDEGLGVVSQSVRVDSSPAAQTSFNAVHSAADFLANGFRTGREGEYIYYSPDASVLLDERFPRGYCFDVVVSDTAHRTHVGLHFAPAARQRGRVDIDGTLWIDTTTRTLAELTFRYVGIDPLSESLGAGGRIGFRSLPSGVTFIDRWHLRLIGVPAATPSERPSGARTPLSYQVRDVGGELAEARWSDGRVWSAPLATLHITAVGDGNRPAPRARLLLMGTEYRAVANAEGRAIIPNVLPGPYTIGVDDPLLRSLDLWLPTRRSLTAVRGASIVVRAEVDGPITMARTACGRTDGAPRPNESWLIGRIVDETGRPVDGARWRVFEAEEGQWKSRSDLRPVGTNGVFAFCRSTSRGRTIEVVAYARGREIVRERRVLDAPLVAVAVTLPGPDSPRGAPTVIGSLTLAGMATDSISGTPLANARVRLVNTPFEGATDEHGRFVIGGATGGRYVVEVGAATLDTFGLVSRYAVDLHDSLPPLILRVPNVAQARTAACRPSGGHGSSLIVGRLSTTTGDLAAISGYRVVAAWQSTQTDSASNNGSTNESASGFVRAVPDPNTGTFRICDAPVGRPLIISAEADRMSGGSANDTLTLSAPNALARMDLMLDRAIAAPATWSGTVVADSGDYPVSGSDVVLADLGVTMRTNQLGQFRIRGLPAGPHRAHVRMPGYEPWLGTVRINPGQAIEQQIVLVRTGRPDAMGTPVVRVR